MVLVVLVAEGGAGMRTMDIFMATGRPASATGKVACVVAIPDLDDTRGCLLLKVTLQAEIGIPNLQHLVVDRAVRHMTSYATFTGSFMLKYIRSVL